ncbi:MAG: transcriptional repressor [Gemmatimonadales bacterium]
MERNTRQRGAIRRVFQRTDRPLGTGEVLASARGEVAGLGIATVYRNIRILLDEEWLVPVEMPGQPPRYELQGKPHHHHFHCHRCDRLFEAPGCLDTLQQLVPPGCRLDAHEIILNGICADCLTTS